MKRIALLALAAVALVAFAQPVIGPSKLHRGSSTTAQPGTYTDTAACAAAAQASNPGPWRCVAPVDVPCPPAPASAQPGACPDGQVSTWTQTRTVKSSPPAQCWVTSAWKPTTAPAGKCTVPPAVPSTWATVAIEGGTFTLTAQTVVRFGFVEWVNKTLPAGTHACTIAVFGKDPKPGNAKACQAGSTVATPPVITPPPTTTPPPVTPPASSPTPMPPTSAVPVTDEAMARANAKVRGLQVPQGGYDRDMLIPTPEKPSDSDEGAFRTVCYVTRIAKDDPIVYPGQPGRSHPHTFFGNTLVDAHSTAQSLFTTGNSTCRGGTINRSSYWVPSMIDTSTGEVVMPMESNFYYKTGYTLPPAAITEIPLGLRMIAGDASGTPDKRSAAVIWACVWEGGNSGWTSSIPTDCRVSGRSWVIMGIDYPQCWDGTSLDSPDHKSHMANAIAGNGNNTGRCPTSHPVALPAIAYQILYQYTSTDQLKSWRLSSDNYDTSKPAGYSGHGDYFMAWKPEAVKAWTNGCDRAKKDCHSHLLGDGRAMVIP